MGQLKKTILQDTDVTTD